MSTVEEAQASVQVPPAAQAVKARGYWELIWIRLRRDKVAIAGGIFIIVMFLVAFVGAPIASHLLGHGPNDQFFDAVDANSFLPVGPMTHVKTPDGGTTLFILGADSTIGRDLFLRLLYGAQTSLEVAVFATFFVGLPRSADGGARRILPRRGRHRRLAADRDDHGLPGAPVHHRDLGHGGTSS